MALLRLLLLLLVFSSCYPIVARFDCHGIVLHSILILLLCFLNEAGFSSVGDFHDLLLEFFVTHQLLDCNEVPSLEQSPLVLDDVRETECFDEIEVVAVDSVLDSRH